MAKHYVTDEEFAEFAKTTTYCRLVGRDTVTELTVADQPPSKLMRLQVVNDGLFSTPKPTSVKLEPFKDPKDGERLPKGSVLMTLPNGERAPLRNGEFLVLWEGITLHYYNLSLYPFATVADLIVQLPKSLLSHGRHLYYTTTCLFNAYDGDGYHRARTTIYVRRTEEEYRAEIAKGWETHSAIAEKQAPRHDKS